MRTKILYSLLGLYGMMVFTACKNNWNLPEDNVPALKVHYDTIVNKELRLSTIFNSYDFVILKKNASDHRQIFGEITKLLAHDDRIIIFDKDLTNGIFVYDTTGKFVFSIVKGKGPKEITNAEDFCVNDEDGNLIILDNGSKALKIFSLSNGEFIRNIALANFYEGIEYAYNHKVLLKNSGQASLREFKGSKLIYLPLDNAGEIDKVPIYFNKINFYLSYGTGNGIFMKSDSVIYFAEPYGNRIYQFSRNTGKALTKLIIDFGENDLKNSAKDISTAEDLSKLSLTTSYITGISTSMSYDNIIYTVSHKGELNYLFVDRNLTHADLYQSIRNDLYNIPVVTFSGYSSDGITYSHIAVETIQTYLDKGVALDSHLRKKLGDNFNMLTSNPVIVKLYNK